MIGPVGNRHLRGHLKELTSLNDVRVGLSKMDAVTAVFVEMRRNSERLAKVVIKDARL